MDKNDLELAAYAAAYKILALNLSFAQYATPGYRQSRRVDAIANVIKDIFGNHACSAGEKPLDRSVPSLPPPEGAD